MTTISTYGISTYGNKETLEKITRCSVLLTSNSFNKQTLQSTIISKTVLIEEDPTQT